MLAVEDPFGSSTASTLACCCCRRDLTRAAKRPEGETGLRSCILFSVIINIFFSY